MWPLIFLLISSALAENCTHLWDNEVYTRSTILNIKGLPTNLVYNPKSKDLLFTLIDLETLQNDEVQTKMDQYILRHGELVKIDNVNGQASIVDEKNNIVYIATDNGLNVLNETDIANHLGFRHDDIVQLAKPRNSDYIYAVLFPDNEVYKLNVIKNEKEKIENVPCAFILAVDDHENIFYECESKYIKVLLRGFQESIEFVGLSKNSARAIGVDEQDRVIIAANDGVYWLRPDYLIPRKLMDLDFVPAGIAFYRDNIYLSTTDVIYEYSPCDVE